MLHAQTQSEEHPIGVLFDKNSEEVKGDPSYGEIIGLVLVSHSGLLIVYED